MDYQTRDVLFSVLSFVVGGMIGSFLNVCIHRFPRGESIVFPRSHCPKCDALIEWYDNIPIVSWLILRAKCRHCGASISWQYPLVEAITAFLFLFVYWRFGFVIATPVYMAFAASLVLVTFVDLADWTIPDSVSLPGIPIGLACAVIGMYFPASGFQQPPLHVDIFDSLIGALIGGGSLYLLDKITLVLLKKPGMGFGDVKLNAMLGAFLGWRGVLLVIVLAALIGSIVGISVVSYRKWRNPQDEDHYLPFGPSLSAAGLVVLFFGADIITKYAAFLRGSIGP